MTFLRRFFMRLSNNAEQDLPGVSQRVSLCFFGPDNLTGSGQPTRIAGKSDSPSCFAVLGVDVPLGRTFDPITALHSE